jgi:hypothetical protein
LASAYRAFFHGQCGIPGAKELCKARAPPSCKFFFWLAILGRCWTSHKLQRHNLQNCGLCALCDQHQESIGPLIVGCVYAREVWFCLLWKSGRHQLVPTADNTLVDRWLASRKRIIKEDRKGFDSFVLLTAWSLWMERNDRVFGGVLSQPQALVALIFSLGRLWVAAHFSSLARFL